MLARLKALLRRPVVWIMAALGVGALFLLRGKGTAAGVPRAAATAPDAGLTGLDMLPQQPLNLGGLPAIPSPAGAAPAAGGLPPVVVSQQASSGAVSAPGPSGPPSGYGPSGNPLLTPEDVGVAAAGVDQMYDIPGAGSFWGTPADVGTLGGIPAIEQAAAANVAYGYSPQAEADRARLLAQQPAPAPTGHGGGGMMSAWDVAPHGAASDPADVGRDYLDTMGRAGLVPSLRPSRKGSKLWGDLLAAEAMLREGRVD